MNNLNVDQPTTGSHVVIYSHGSYQLATILSCHKNHVLVEFFAKQSQYKVALKHYIYTIDTTNLTQFANQLEELIQQIDINLLWELVEDNSQKTDITDLAKLYFGDDVSHDKQTALLFALDQQGIDFQGYGNCKFSKRSISEREKWQAIKAKQREDEKNYQILYNKVFTAYNSVSSTKNIKKHVNVSSDTYDHTSDLSSIVNLDQLFIKPDKHSTTYKVFNTISREHKIPILQLVYQLGLITDIPQFFIQMFLAGTYPTNNEKIDSKEKQQHYIKNISQNLEDKLDSVKVNHEVSVFSIDDSSTTEIDDAFSVRTTKEGYIIGVHIAAPSLDSNLASVISSKISTVYYPNGKITMLPQEVIEYYSLFQGHEVPVVSIYFTVDFEYNISTFDSVLEKVKVARNLDVEKLEKQFTLENLELTIGYDYENELKILYHMAEKLAKSRGKPTVNTLVREYNFAVEKDIIKLTPRNRGNPIDKIVSELMILANCSWGRMLTNSFIPAIYRVKKHNYPVKMTTTPDRHIGLNVDYYTWATSPLRRASDYMNQHQIISLIVSDKKHYLATSDPFAKVVDSFDAIYTKYIDFQNKMERYYALQYLLQESISEIEATFVYGYKVQLDGVPIIVDVEKLTSLKTKGEKIKLKICKINLIDLTFEVVLRDKEK